MAAAIPAYSQDDRNALALMLLPFMIVAAAIGSGHHFRSTMRMAPDVIAMAPSQPMQAAPRARTRPVPMAPAPIYPTRAPEIAAPAPISIPGRLDYPKSTPQIDIANIAIPSPRPTYPTQRPDIAAPEMQLAGPAAAALRYPTAAPEIQIANIDLAGPETIYPLQAPDIAGPGSSVGGAGEVCRAPKARLAAIAASGPRARSSLGPTMPATDPTAFGLAVAAAARAQTQGFVIYTANYRSMAYPMGDVAALYGACTDVIIRAYRAVGIDLQRRIKNARVGSGDTNIDHRRTATLGRYFTRIGASLPITAFPEDYKPGDIVSYYRPHSRVSNAHIAIVSDVLAPSGRPMIVHNRGYGPQLEDALFVDRITGHYRYLGQGDGKGRGRDVAPEEGPPGSIAGRDLVKASYAGGKPEFARDPKAARRAAKAKRQSLVR